MKVSDAVVEVAARAAYAEAMKDHKPNPGGNWKKEMLSVRERYRANARAALEVAIPLVLGEPVGYAYIARNSGELTLADAKHKALPHVFPLYAPKEQQP